MLLFCVLTLTRGMIQCLDFVWVCERMCPNVLMRYCVLGSYIYIERLLLRPRQLFSVIFMSYVTTADYKEVCYWVKCSLSVPPTLEQNVNVWLCMEVHVSVCAHVNIFAPHLMLEWISADWTGLFITKLIVPVVPQPCFTRPCLTHNSSRIVLEAVITSQKDTSTTPMGFLFVFF